MQKKFSFEQATMLLSLNRKAFPAFYKNFTSDDATTLADLWVDLFSDVDAQLVIHTFRQALKECEYPVTPADVNKRIKALQKTQKPSELELWAQFDKAVSEIFNLAYPYICDGYNLDSYNRAKETYNALPFQIKSFAHSVKEMVNYGLMDSTEFIQFVKPQFLKRMPEIEERQGLCIGIPAQIQELLGNAMAFKRLEAGGVISYD